MTTLATAGYTITTPVTNPLSNAQTFLAAFNAIERHLRRTLPGPDRSSFMRLVDEASRHQPEVLRFANDLREYAELRNAIVHRSRREPIAEPHAEVVAHLQRILTILTDPPKVLPFFGRPVITIDQAEPVATAVSIMYRESISQVPVFRDDTFEALLTTKTVTRWLGASVADDIFSLLDTPVSHVLQFAEGADSYAIVPSRSTLAHVMERFQQAEVNGNKLQAVFISRRGKATEELLGVITTSDLPRIIDALEGRDPKDRI